MRDENDELQVQLENLKAELNTMGKRKHRRRHLHSRGDDDSVSERSRGKGHRSKESLKINKVGSYLSDYTKPVIIRRNEEGETTEEEEINDDLNLMNEDADENGILLTVNISYAMFYILGNFYFSYAIYFVSVMKEGNCFYYCHMKPSFTLKIILPIKHFSKFSALFCRPEAKDT